MLIKQAHPRGYVNVTPGWNYEINGRLYVIDQFTGFFHADTVRQFYCAIGVIYVEAAQLTEVVRPGFIGESGVHLSKGAGRRLIDKRS